MSSTTPSYEHIAFLASPNPEAKEACERLSQHYGNAAPETADVIVALGGDGFMLQTLHRFMSSGKPIYGMHRGTVGFLMNEYSAEHLQRRLAAARKTAVHPLLMEARDGEGHVHRSHAFNEVSLFRQTSQAAHLRILVDDKERMAELVHESGGLGEEGSKLGEDRRTRVCPIIGTIAIAFAQQYLSLCETA